MDQISSPPSEIHDYLLEQKQKDLSPSIISKIESQKETEYLSIINEKIKFLQDYEKLEKELQSKRLLLENDLNSSILKSKSLLTPQKNNNSIELNNINSNSSNQPRFLMKSASNFNKDEILDPKSDKEDPIFASYFIKLSSENKIKENQEENYTFQPKINKKTTVFNEKTEKSDKKNYESMANLTSNRLDLLYQDGKFRLEKQKEVLKQAKSEIFENVNQNKIDLNSKKIVLKNIEKSLFSLLSELEDENSPGFLNFRNIAIVLKKLGVLKGEYCQRDNYNENPEISIEEKEKIGIERIELELKFQSDFWKLLILPQLFGLKNNEIIDKINENTIKLIPFPLIMDILLVLIEKNLDKKNSASIIRDRIHLSYKKNEVNKILSLKKGLENENSENNSNIMSEIDKEEIKLQEFESKIFSSIEQIVKNFRILNTDKTIVMNIYSNSSQNLSKSPENSQKNKEFTFKPKINSKSKLIDTHHNDNYISKIINSSENLKENIKNRFDLLYQHYKYVSEKKTKNNQLQIQEDSKDCTFAPKINKQIKKNDKTENEEEIEQETFQRLYQLHKKKVEKEENYEKIIKEREEAQLESCTFYPKTNTSKNLEKSLYSINASTIKGAEKAIERFKKAQSDKKDKEIFFENMGKPKNDNLQPTVFKPFSFEKRYNNDNANNLKEEPLLYLDINYGPGKIARIPVRKTDDPQVLCKNFSKIYSLNEKMQITLLETIQNIFKTQVSEENK